MSQAFIIPTIKRPFPSRRQLTTMSDAELLKGADLAASHIRFHTEQIKAERANEVRHLKEIARREVGK